MILKRILIISCLVLLGSVGLVGEEGYINCNPITTEQYQNLIKGYPWVISMDMCCNGKLDGGKINFEKKGTYFFSNSNKTGKWYITMSTRNGNTNYYIVLKNDDGSMIFSGKFIDEGIWKWEGIMVRSSDGKIGCWRIRHP